MAREIAGDTCTSRKCISRLASLTRTFFELTIKLRRPFLSFHTPSNRNGHSRAGQSRCQEAGHGRVGQMALAASGAIRSADWR